jgi:hypothetical protein
MAHELKLSNFSILTSEPLSASRKVKLDSAVLAARSHIATARLKSFEALACTCRPGVVLADLPPASSSTCRPSSAAATPTPSAP